MHSHKQDTIIIAADGAYARPLCPAQLALSRD